LSDCWPSITLSTAFLMKGADSLCAAYQPISFNLLVFQKQV